MSRFSASFKKAHILLGSYERLTEPFQQKFLLAMLIRTRPGFRSSPKASSPGGLSPFPTRNRNALNGSFPSLEGCRPVTSISAGIILSNTHVETDHQMAALFSPHNFCHNFLLDHGDLSFN